MKLDVLSKPPVLAVLLVGFVTGAFYIVANSSDEATTLDRVVADSMTMTNDRTPGKAASVTSLIGGLEAKLVENPDDAKGWLLLAQSYDHLGDPRAAWAAYSQAKELGLGDDALEMKLAANIGQLLPKN